MLKHGFKRVLALVILAVIIFSFVSCTKDAYAPVGMKRITDKDVLPSCTACYLQSLTFVYLTVSEGGAPI